MTLAHVWPGVTPLNVWDLELDMWLVMATAADGWQAKRNEVNRNRQRG